MFRSKAFGGFLLAASLFCSSGCYTFMLLQSDLPDSPEQADSEITIRVTTVDGEELILEEPWVNRRVLGGKYASRLRGQGTIEIPLARVERIEEKEFDRRTTYVWVGFIIGALVATQVCADGSC